MTATGTAAATGEPRRWLMLVAGMVALAAACAFQYGLPYLVPALRDGGLTLTQAIALVTAPILGLTVTLVAWGAAADRWGERLVLVTGLGLAGSTLGAATLVSRPWAVGVCLAVAGAGGGAVHAASGRLILGWFARHERGLAMGLRQTAQPLGVALSAMAVPPLSAFGLAAPLACLAGACLAAALLVALVVREPDRPSPAHRATGTSSPYGTGFLWRLHAASALLIVPQFTVATFAFDYLVRGCHWPATSAGLLLATSQAGGAATRLAAGWWSDRIRSRLRPMRAAALAIAATMGALAVAASARASAASLALAVAATVTVSPNGLAFTAVAERAGVAWAGRALGVHNTAQNLTAVVAPPLLATVITTTAGGGEVEGYGLAFATTVAFSLAAAVVIPVAAEQP